jgi:pimeloyl-ACP methyl ester carboxylesterase
MRCAFRPITTLLMMITALLAVATSVTPAASDDRVLPRFVVSDEPVVDVPAGRPFTFGWLEVPEDRARPEGRTVRLPVYIFKSRSPNPKPDPVLYTAGGPGGSSLGSVPYTASWSYLEDRDVIFFEQRGARYAQPHLDCPEWDEAFFRTLSPSMPRAERLAILEDAAARARARLTAEGIDLDAYDTSTTVADLIDLRKALGVERWNLLTVSYSTKIAQVLMREDPGGVRSVVMDSPMPLDRRYDEESNRALLEVLDRLFADCAADPACHAAYPDLGDRFRRYLTYATTTPIEVRVTEPDAGVDTVVPLRGKDIVALLGLGSTGPSPGVPAQISAIIDGDHALLAERILSAMRPGRSAGMGMRLSVWCAEESPFASRAIIDRERAAHPPIAGRSPATIEPSVCDCWKVERADAIDVEPIESNIPTLVLSGDYDIFTPLSWAEHLAGTLGNAQLVVFRGWGHVPTSNWSNPCAMTMARGFFDEPNAPLDLDCVNSIGRPAFDAGDQ